MHKVIELEDGVIPELEEQLGKNSPIFWTKKQEKTLKRYYGKGIEMDDLIKHIGKSKNAIQKKASVLGLTHKKE